MISAPAKLCKCGCGKPAPVAVKSSSRFGHVKGEPMRFVNGHAGRPRSSEPTFECPSALGRCFGTTGTGQRCKRQGVFAVGSQQFCRSHSRSVPRCEEDVYEQHILLCACGCGNQANPWYSVFKTLEEDGMTHAKIAAKFGFHRSFVSKLIRCPAKYVRGHNAVAFWDSAEGRERKADVPLSFHRQITSFDRLVAVQESEEGATGERTGFLTKGVAPLQSPAADVEYEQERLSNLLDRLVGNATPEDILRMDDSTREALARRLTDEGFGPGRVLESERERLREPNRHAGASIAKAAGHGGGRRSRAEQKQVTREHHVRDLTKRQKQEHKQLRESRRAAA